MVRESVESGEQLVEQHKHSNTVPSRSLNKSPADVISLDSPTMFQLIWQSAARSISWSSPQLQLATSFRPHEEQMAVRILFGKILTQWRYFSQSSGV